MNKLYETALITIARACITGAAVGTAVGLPRLLWGLGKLIDTIKNRTPRCPCCLSRHGVRPLPTDEYSEGESTLDLYSNTWHCSKCHIIV